MPETSAQRFKRIVAENAMKAQQKKTERETYERSRVRVNIDELDPLFSASPAALIETRDVQVLKAIPEIIRTIELTPGERGERGIAGPAGRDGKDGRDGVDGKEGKSGRDGKDATVSFGELKGIANSSIKTHEETHNHDPFLLGTKKVSEAGMEKGQVLTYDGDKLIYTTIKQVATQVAQYVPRGFISEPGTNTLPSQTGNSGKFLKTNGTIATWDTPSGSGAVDSVNGATGVVVLDTSDIDPTTNRNYVTDAQQTVIGNTSGTNTGDQSLFRTIAVAGQSDVVADSTTDTLTLVAGSNIEITTNPTTDTITITGTGSGGSGITRSVNAISTTTTAGATAATDYVYICTSTFTLTMPTAVSNTNRYTVKNAGAGVITVAFDGAQTGEGDTTLTLNPGSSVDLISDNSNFFII